MIGFSFPRLHLFGRCQLPRKRAVFHIGRPGTLLVSCFRPWQRMCGSQGRLEVNEVLERHLPGSTVSSARLALVVAAAYFVADTLMNKIALGDGWEIFWPLNGITIAMLTMRPP